MSPALGGCDREAIRRLMELARLRLGEDEACAYIGEVEDWASRLLEEAGEGEPLYYAWDEPPPPLEEPLEPDALDREAALPRLGPGGWVVLPWRGRAQLNRPRGPRGGEGETG